MKSIIRRRFLQSSAVLAGSLFIPSLPAFRLAQKPLRLGGPIFLKSDDPEELAREHRRLGYSSAYVPAVDLKDTTKIDEIRKAFAAQNVILAEVGAWVNMLDQDAEKRRKNLVDPIVTFPAGDIARLTVLALGTTLAAAFAASMLLRRLRPTEILRDS